MQNKFHPVIMDDISIATQSIDSKNNMFLTASPSQFRTKSQFTMTRKINRLQPLTIEKEKRDSSNDLEKKVSKEITVSQVQDWTSFISQDIARIKEFNETAEKFGRASFLSDNASSPVSPQRVNRYSQPLMTLEKKQSLIILQRTDNDEYLERMKLGNKLIPSLSRENFMKCVRQKEKLTEYAKVYQQSPENIYLTLNNSQQFVPKTFGLVQQTGKQLTQVNASRYIRSIDDCRVYAEAMNTSQSQSIQKMQLNNSIFEQRQFKDLLNSFPNTVKDLELKDCRLNFKHMDILMQYVNKNNLYKINLEQNYIRDQGCSIIMKHLLNNHSLQYLNLSNNKITENSGVMISNFLKLAQRLSELYLGFNNLASGGGVQIWKALYKNTSIKILDMSHNAIASLECAQSIAKALSRPYNELVHIDLRYNKFNQAQSQIIADGLIKNETIYGFHFEGNYNDIVVNPNGFLINRKEQQRQKNEKIDELNKQPQYFRLLDEEKTELNTKQKTDDDIFLALHRSRRMQSTGLNKQKINMINKLDVCWICEGWQEIRFQWNPKSGSSQSQPIFIHFDFDDYHPYLMTYLNGDFFFVKMCPPNKSIKYFFSNPILGIQCTAEDQPVYQLATPLPSIPFLYNNTILVDGNTLSQVNELLTSNTQTLFDRYVPLCATKPRETMALFDFSPYLNIASTKWSVETSIFRHFPPDTENSISECFEFDFSNSKVSRLVKETELPEVKETLKLFYCQLFHSYKYFASGNSTAPIPCLSSTDYIEFLMSTDVIEGVKPNDIDIGFTSTSGAKDVQFPQSYEKGIVRCQFMEVLIRFCNDKYIRAGTHSTMVEALQALQKQCSDFLSKFDTAQSWRKLRLWNEKCDLLIHDRMPMIKCLYKFACKISKKPQQYKYDYVSPQDFRDLLKQSNIICDELSERECYLAYLQGMITQKDELYSPKHYQMNLYEFIEAISRVAEKVSIIRGEKVLELDNRRAQDLQDKLSGLLLLMYLSMSDEIKKAMPNDPEVKHIDRCMNNDFRSKKQKLEESFTDGDEPPYDVKVELPILIAQVPQTQAATGPAKRLTIRNIKILKPSTARYLLTNFVQFFISLNERT